MADELTPDDDPDFGDAVDPHLAALLAEPAMWDEPEPSGADAVVAAIFAERATQSSDAPGEPTDPVAHEASNSKPVVEIGAYRRRFVPVMAAAAAVVVLLAGALIIAAVDGDDDDGVVIALAATELAPGASAEADVADTPLGTRILLDLSGLPPAADGTYYEAWLRQSPEVGVSAGTFHMRGGDGEIELWAGVSLADYPLITVTVQEEGGGAASSGVVVLRGSSG